MFFGKSDFFKMNAPIIVLEGLDACGKSTQKKLLLENLENQGISVGQKTFPGYEVTPAGVRIAAYLRGEFGAMKNLDPRMIANLYAADRLFQAREIGEIRLKNDVVIFDRGVTSNIIYTAARAESEEQVKKLENFVEKLEYELFGFPRESLVLFLDASESARTKIHAAKNRPADIHEADESYLQKVRKVALSRCDQDFRWQRIKVDSHGAIRSKTEIATEILNIVLEKLQKK
jgi:dTMP kinase